MSELYGILKDALLLCIKIDTKEEIVSHNDIRDLYSAFNYHRLNTEIISNARKKLPIAAEILNKVANTFIYRSYMLGERRISYINHKLSNDVQADIERLHQLFVSLLVWLSYRNTMIKRSLKSKRSHKINFGVMPRFGGAIHNAYAQLHTHSIATVDISKFFNSVTLPKIIDHNLFLEAYKINTNYQYFAHLLKYHPFTLESLNEALYFINHLFISLVPFFLHNGHIPTGMTYSTILSNYLFTPVDKKLESYLRDKSSNDVYYKHTRYIDDVTFSAQSYDAKPNDILIDINFIKDVESIINEFGFYLKYDKTKIYGGNDTKVVNGISFGGVNKQVCKVNSNYKYELAMYLKAMGHDKLPLTSVERGKLYYIRSVNLEQYAYCLSHYFMYQRFAQSPQDVIGTYEYRVHIQNEILHGGAFYDLFVKPIMGGR